MKSAVKGKGKNVKRMNKRLNRTASSSCKDWLIDDRCKAKCAKLAMTSYFLQQHNALIRHSPSMLVDRVLQIYVKCDFVWWNMLHILLLFAIQTIDNIRATEDWRLAAGGWAVARGKLMITLIDTRELLMKTNWPTIAITLKWGSSPFRYSHLLKLCSCICFFNVCVCVCYLLYS